MKAKHSGLFSRGESRKRNYQKHRKIGLCVCCSRKAGKRSCYCKKHRIINIKNCRKYRELSKEVGK